MDSTKWKIRLAIFVMWFWLQYGVVTTKAVPASLENLSPENGAVMPGYQINGGHQEALAESSEESFSRNDMQKSNNQNILKSKRNGNSSNHLEPGGAEENTDHHSHGDEEQEEHSHVPGTGSLVQQENLPGINDALTGQNEHLGPGQVPGESSEQDHNNEDQNLGHIHDNEGGNLEQGARGQQHRNLDHSSQSVDGQSQQGGQENSNDENDQLNPGEIPIITDTHADEQLGPGSQGNIHEPIQTGEAENSHNAHTNNNGDLVPGEIPLIPGDNNNHNEHVEPGFQSNSHEQGEPEATPSSPHMQSNENGHRHPNEIPNVPGFDIHQDGQPVSGEIFDHNAHHDNTSEPEPDPHQGPDSGSDIPPFQGHGSQSELTSPRPSTKPPPTGQIQHNAVGPASHETESVHQITPSSQQAMLTHGQTIQEQITEPGPVLFSSYSEEMGNSLHSSAVPQQHLPTASYNIRLTSLSVTSGHFEYNSLTSLPHHIKSFSFHTDTANAASDSTEIHQSSYSQYANIATIEYPDSFTTPISPTSVTLFLESSSSRKEVKVPFKIKKSSAMFSLSEETTSVTVGLAHSTEIVGISPSVVSVEPTQSNVLSLSTDVTFVTTRTVTSGHSSFAQTVGNGSGFATTLRSYSSSRQNISTTPRSQPSSPGSRPSTPTSRPVTGPVLSLPSVSHEIVIHENTTSSTVTTATTKKMKKNITNSSTMTTVIHRSVASSGTPFAENFTRTTIINQTGNVNVGSTPSTLQPKTTKLRVTTHRATTSRTRTHSTLHDNDSRVHPTYITSPAIPTNTSLSNVSNSTQSTRQTHTVGPSVASSASTLRPNTSTATSPRVLTPRGTVSTPRETRPSQTTPTNITIRGTTLRQGTSRETTVNRNLSTPVTQETNISGETTKRMTSAKTSTLPERITSMPQHRVSSSASTATTLRQTSHSSSSTSSHRPTSSVTSLPISSIPTTPSALPVIPAVSSSIPSRPTTTVTTPKWNPTPITHPPVFATIKLRMTWDDFCDNEGDFLLELVHIFHRHARREVEPRQIVFVNMNVPDCVDVLSPVSFVEHISINMYLVDVWGRYDITLTIDCCKVIQLGFNANKQSYFRDKLVEVKLNSPVETATASTEGERLVMEPGIIIAIVIASVGGLCCITLIMLQVIIRRRYAKTAQNCPASSRHCSFTSTDSIALGSVNKARPHSGLFNPALDLTALIEPSVPINLTTLANKCLDVISLYEEFQMIPNYTPQLSTVPVGAEDKNRYANVIPIPHTRVKLKKLEGQPVSDYINANYITGYMDDKRAYVATQAPMTNTIHDFWRMMWEQQCRVITMLTAMDEQGHPKCAPYWPYSETDPLKRYGDFVIMLKKKDIYQEYILSSLELKDMETNLVREIKHFWYTCWPVHGIPEPISLVKFVLDTRPYYEDSGAPLIVHCSPGTGRTGTMITLDICMRQLENKRMVDIMGCVHQMRQERAGVIQTKEQYALIYMALNEYACVLTTPCISAASSSATLQTLH